MLLSLNADTQGLFKKCGEKNLFQEWKLACPADNHTIFFFLLLCPFPARTGKLHPPGFWAAVLSGGYLKMDTYFHYTLYTGFCPPGCFSCPHYSLSPWAGQGSQHCRLYQAPGNQEVLPEQKVLWESCTLTFTINNPLPLYPLRVDTWHSSGSSASLTKLAAWLQGQESPLCTSVKGVFFNTSEYLQWLNQFVPR